MKLMSLFRQLVLIAITMTPGSLVWAQWELDNTRSSVNFVSIKNDSVGEVHGFSSLIGFIGASGNVQLTIDLNSVETKIDVRDDRMREMLFETARFPSAKVTAQVPPEVLAAAAEGGTVTADLPLTLSLHGMEQSLTVAVVVVGDGDGYMRVFSARPLLLNAADFGLDKGITALREIAGLQAISNSVPVTLQLVFVPAQ